MPRPRAGDWLEDEIADWKRAGIDLVVSLLEDGEIAELGLEQEPEACRKHGLGFIRFPLPDRGVPVSGSSFSEVIETLAEELRDGRGVGIHCRIGVGRAALLATGLLVACGLAPNAAWSVVEQSRGCRVPDTPQQCDWLSTWAARRTNPNRSG